MEIHQCTWALLYRMFHPEQVWGLILGFLADYAEMKRDGIEGMPFMILQFGNETPIMSPNEAPPSEKYIWN
jgi:hypothetical protein